MAQSYVGKPAISKGIGRAIRKFVAFASSADFLGYQRRACAVPDGPKGALHLVRGTPRSVFRQRARSAGRPSLGKFKRSASWFSAATEESDGGRLPG